MTSPHESDVDLMQSENGVHEPMPAEEGSCTDNRLTESPRQYKMGYSKEEYRAFQLIDRDEEDRLVMQYVQSKDVKTLHRLMVIREQTFRYMAKKYSYLDNEDDMYSEFKEVWLKCVKLYDGSIRLRQVRTKSGELVLDSEGQPKLVAKKTPFNTYLYTSMKNRVGNIYKHNHSKRLCDDNGTPISDSIRSLDYKYGQDGDMTLMDIVSDDKVPGVHSHTETSDLISNLAKGDADIQLATKNFLEHGGYGSLDAACNRRGGTLSISRLDQEILAFGLPKGGVHPSPEVKQVAINHLKKMITSTGNYAGQYEPSSFSVRNGKVEFMVKFDDPSVNKKVRLAIERCRRTISCGRAIR